MHDKSDRQPPRQTVVEWIVSAVIVLGGYALLAAIRRNYFNQDDNFAQFGPVIIGGARSLLEHGIFPEWNPYQLMGAPTAVVGTYALTYPFTYLSYFIADHYWGDPAAWAEFFFLLHAIPAFYVLFRLLSGRGVSRWMALAAAQAFVFCGYHLIIGRSWYYMIPPMLWIPVMFLLLDRLENADSKKWILTAGLSLGAAFHAGNIQMWLYLTGLWTLGLAWRLKGFPKDRRAVLAKAVGIAFLIATAIAFPLLITQVQFVSELDRQSRFPKGIELFLANLLIPFSYGRPGTEAWSPEAHGSPKIGHLYYAGTVFTLAALTATLAWLRKILEKAPSALPATDGLFLTLGWLSFLLTLGKVGVLWTALSFFPPFDKFDHPFKALPFVHFFWIVAGAVFVQRLLTPMEPTRRKKFEGAIALVSFLLVTYHISRCGSALYLFGDKSYPPYPSEIKKMLDDNAGHAKGFVRYDTMAPRWDSHTGFVHSLRHNFGTVYEMGMLDGYDPLVGATEADRNFWRKFQKDEANGLRAAGVTSQIVYNNGQILVGKVPNSDPIVFAPGAISEPFPFEVTFAGITIHNPRSLPGKDLVISFLWRPQFLASVDGKSLELKRDNWGRMAVSTPSSWKEISIQYRPSWLPGIIFACFLLTVSFVAAVLMGIVAWKPQAAS